MPFKFERTEIPDVVIVEAGAFSDTRGMFKETFKKSDFEAFGITTEFVQDNVSRSQKNVIRGLHFQRYPHTQGKLVGVMKGKILDIAVDLRKDSKTYGKYVSVELNDENNRMLWVPPGFAHGFIALEESIVHYKVTNEYNKDSEGGIIWNDPFIKVKWPIEHPLLSDKDMTWGTSKDVYL